MEGGEAVRYAVKTGDGWIIETVRETAPSGRPGVYVALGSDGKPHVVYGDADPSDAWYAVKIGSEWTIEKVGGIDPSLTLDSDNNPHISYYGLDAGNVVLRYSRKSAGRWVNETIDSSDWNLRSSSLALDENNNPHISYSNGTHLKYVAKTGGSWVLHTIDLIGGQFTSLALDSNKSPHILYYGAVDHDAYLKHAYLDTVPPTANIVSDKTVKAGENVNFDASQSSDNVGIVSYRWNFGDGATGTGKTTTYTYTKPGTYTVTLTVMDAAGNSATDTATITVEEAPFPWWIIGAIAAVGIAVIGIVYVIKKRKS